MGSEVAGGGSLGVVHVLVVVVGVVVGVVRPVAPVTFEAVASTGGGRNTEKEKHIYTYTISHNIRGARKTKKMGIIMITIFLY